MRYQILYWQDVPSVIKMFADDGTARSHQLPDWFQQEIDRRAMAQGLTGSDAYLEEWHWGDEQESMLSPDKLLDKLLTELNDQFR